MFRLDGKVALVTGAGPNNGRGIAVALARAGARVAVCDKRASHADAARDAVLEVGGEAVAVPFDVTNAAAVVDGVERVRAALGPVDVLVNNAGLPDPQPGHTGGYLGPFKDSDPSAWSKWIDINLYGSMHCMRATLPSMCERGWGRIVQISSTSGSRGTAIQGSLYGASKAGIEGLLRHVAIEVAGDGVTANALALGPLGDPDREMDERTRAMFALVPVGRAGRPDEVGAAVVWLASDAGEWVTGQTIHLNGGIFQGR